MVCDRLFLKPLLFCLLSLTCISTAQAFFPYGVYDKNPPEVIAAYTDAEYDAYYSNLVALMSNYNLNVIQTVPVSPGIAPDQTIIANRLESLGNMLLANNMKMIFSVGNPLNATWDYVQPGYTYEKVYAHPAIFAYKYGDEPNGLNKKPEDLVSRYNAIRQYYSAPVITVMIAGEHNSENGRRAIAAITESTTTPGSYTIDIDYSAIGFDIADSIEIVGSAGHDGSYTFVSSGGTSDGPAHNKAGPYVIVTGPAGLGNSAAGGTVEAINGRHTAWYKNVWENILGTELRSLRFYPLRRTYFVSDSTYYRDKMYLPPSQVWTEVAGASNTPFYAVLQTIGQISSGDGVSLDYGNFRRLATAAEIALQAHLALANGARGIMWFQLQDSGNLLALIPQDITQPGNTARDGSRTMDAVSELGALVAAHDTLLLNHQPHTSTITTGNADVMAQSRIHNGAEMVYLVNMDTEAANSGTVTATTGYRVRSIKDIYAGISTKHTLPQNAEFDYNLKPGEGKFFELSANKIKGP